MRPTVAGIQHLERTGCEHPRAYGLLGRLVVDGLGVQRKVQYGVRAGVEIFDQDLQLAGSGPRKIDGQLVLSLPALRDRAAALVQVGAGSVVNVVGHFPGIGRRNQAQCNDIRAAGDAAAGARQDLDLALRAILGGGGELHQRQGFFAQLVGCDGLGNGIMRVRSRRRGAGGHPDLAVLDLQGLDAQIALAQHDAGCFHRLALQVEQRHQLGGPRIVVGLLDNDGGIWPAVAVQVAGGQGAFQEHTAGVIGSVCIAPIGEWDAAGNQLAQLQIFDLRIGQGGARQAAGRRRRRTRRRAATAGAQQASAKTDE